VRAVWVDLLDTVMTAMGGWVRAGGEGAGAGAKGLFLRGQGEGRANGGGAAGGETKGGGSGKGKEGGGDGEGRRGISNALAAAASSSKAVEEPMRLLLALVRAVRPRALLRPYARRFVQQLCYLLLADGAAAASRPLAPQPAAAAAATAAAATGRGGTAGAGGNRSAKAAAAAPSPLLEGESLTAALAVVGELAVISPEDLRPYVDLLMPRCARWPSRPSLSRPSFSPLS
jgi:hypothetical protein